MVHFLNQWGEELNMSWQKRYMVGSSNTIAHGHGRMRKKAVLGHTSYLPRVLLVQLQH